jgi:hypothetical protein
MIGFKQRQRARLKRDFFIVPLSVAKEVPKALSFLHYLRGIN